MNADCRQIAHRVRKAREDFAAVCAAPLDAEKKQVTADPDNVLNGVAYDRATRLF